MNNSYKGKILISHLIFRVIYFLAPVVLIIEHDAHGAFGFILIKKILHLSENMKHLLGHEIDVYEGGLYRKQIVFFFSQRKPITSEYLPIDENFYPQNSKKKLFLPWWTKTSINKNSKIFTGYSGWSPYQLDQEVQNKMWTVVEPFSIGLHLTQWSYPLEKKSCKI